MTAADSDVPAWARRGAQESRLAALGAVLAVLVLQWTLPAELAAEPAWLVPLVTLVLLFGQLVGRPTELDRRAYWLRAGSLIATGVLHLAVAWSVYQLVAGLVDGEFSDRATVLLASGGAIWTSNVLVFALWFWEFDRGGPAARARADTLVPDFIFPQMQNPDLADPEWSPQFVDYFYLAFTNATAFSPTDVMPMSRWAKLLMTAETAISLLTGVLVIARAVNVLK
ncbi:hypothetical protein [Nocardia sp. NPDC048505]|uniref:hypothetical protein n=1 Tax=unclassified Nocardia TaxID=2637762 RepID=UPI0033CA51A9